MKEGVPQSITGRYTNKWPFTGNIAIDLVATTISFYLETGKKVTELRLRKDYYEIFEDYVIKDTEIKIGTQLTWGDVKINPGKEEEYFNDPVEIIFG